MIIRFAVLFMTLISVARADGLQAWEGVWTGTCQHIVQGQVRFQFFPVLKIKSISSHRYEWRKDYPATQSTPAMAKDYEMVVIDADSGRYLLDEKDGFTIPTRLKKATLTSSFEVSGMTFRNKMILSGNSLNETLETYQLNPQKLLSVQSCTYRRSLESSARTRW